MFPSYGWGSTASRLQGVTLLFSTKNNCKSNKFLYFIRYDNIEARNYYVSFIIIIV